MGKVIALLRPQVAVRGLYSAERDGKRKQTIRSPFWTIDAAREALGGTIPLDPFADKNPKYHFAVTNWSRGSLRRVWDQPSYVNPTFDDFQLNLAYARAQALHTGLPTLVLGPWRSHRRGFMDAIQGALCIYFKAFAFRDQRNTTPFPCFLAAWNAGFPRTAYEVDRKQW